MAGECSVDGCTTPSLARGWCSKHWQRWRSHGDPTFIRTGRGLSVEDRFWRFVLKTDGCWYWTGHFSGKYPAFTVRHGDSRSANVFAYELVVGPVPAGRWLAHTCHLHLCVNPAHMAPVTVREAVLRARGFRIPVLRGGHIDPARV